MSNRNDHVANHWAAVVFALCAVAILYLVFRPEPPPAIFPASDKFLHVLAFAGLGVVAGWAFLLRLGNVLWLWLGGIALILELAQSMVQPLRQFSFLDMLANGTGVFLAFGYWRFRLMNKRARV